MYDGQKLLLIVVIFNFHFRMNKYEDAVDQFDSLTGRLILSVTNRPLINCGILLRHLFLCRVQSVMGHFSMAAKSIFITEFNNGIITRQVYFSDDFE